MSQEIDLQEHVRAVLEIGGSLWGTASLLIPLAAKHAPESFMHFVPEDVQLAMREDCANPPDTIDGLFIFESANYRPSFFEGLTEEEAAQKIECERRARKQERLTGMKALKHFFDVHPLPPLG